MGDSGAGVFPFDLRNCGAQFSADESVILKRNIGYALFVSGLILVGMGVRALLLPQYQATAKVWVAYDSELIWEYWERHPERKPANVWDPYAPEAFAENLLSDPVLAKLVERLQLDKKWAVRFSNRYSPTNQVIEMLKTQLRIRLPESRIQHADVFRVYATDVEPDLAVAIANTMADAYNDRYLEKRKQISQNAIQSSEKECGEMQVAIDAAEKIAAGLQGETNSRTGNEQVIFKTSKNLELLRRHLEIQRKDYERTPYLMARLVERAESARCSNRLDGVFLILLGGSMLSSGLFPFRSSKGIVV